MKISLLPLADKISPDSLQALAEKMTSIIDTWLSTPKPRIPSAELGLQSCSPTQWPTVGGSGPRHRTVFLFILFLGNSAWSQAVRQETPRRWKGCVRGSHRQPGPAEVEQEQGTAR